MNQLAPAPGKDQYMEAVRVNSALLEDAARLGLTEVVSTCPGWYVATLVAHIGEVQRFWALQIRSRAQEKQDLPRAAFDSCPGLFEWLDGVDAGAPDLEAVPDGLITWFERATVELLAAFQDIDPEEAVWHWSGDNRAIAHMRNQAMEATVHRWDAQNAYGAVTPVDPIIARDGIDQHFEVQIAAARQWGTPIQGSGETYHFHRTDGEGEWMVRFEGDGVAVRHQHGTGDVALRGSVEDIFLWLWGRISGERLDVRGDTSLLDRYRTLVPTS
ncbi:MAG: maleylpyruvate isomerase family mycothiol-dependent enzyme [Chloroflexota bacterium]